MPSISSSSKYLDQLQLGELRAKWNASGTQVLRYYIDFRHKGLDLHKELSAPEIGILQNKVDALMASWDKKYEAVLVTRSVAEGKDVAAEMTIESERARSELRSILLATIKVNDVVDWSKLKSTERYKRKPFDEPRPPQPKAIPLPTEPTIGFFDRLFGGAKKKLEQHAAAVEAVTQQRARESTKFDLGPVDIHLEAMITAARCQLAA